MFVLDSSVLFDLVHGGIDREVLGHYSMETPLLMVSEVIEHHERLISSGLTFVPLSGEEEKLADAMLGEHGSGPGASRRQQKKRLSRVDCNLLALARSRQRCLLVADQALRDIARGYGVESRGLLWLIESMAEQHVISSSHLAAALERIALRPRARLPVPQVRELLDKLRS
ncbi:MAG: hypothetical protein KDI66_06065 [Xanthomonadales bacterium]|nr:hypothetical protein [Xanthomonadales bacterium]